MMSATASLFSTYHRAYDNGLIYLDEEYTMQINSEKVSEWASAQSCRGY